MSEEDIYIYIYKNINKLINDYKFISISESDLQKYVKGLENPNDLDIASEVLEVHKWIGQDPKRIRSWKKTWQTRLQSWIIRTVRYSKPRTAAYRVQQTQAVETTHEPVKRNNTAVREYETSTIQLLQTFLMKYPALYRDEPVIYTVVPFPNEWSDPEHWGYYCRHLRKGFEHLYDQHGHIPEHIAEKYGVHFSKQQHGDNNENQKIYNSIQSVDRSYH